MLKAKLQQLDRCGVLKTLRSSSDRLQLDRYLDGEVIRNRGGRFFLHRERIPLERKYGLVPIAKALDLPQKGFALFKVEDFPLDKAVFLDTETTGLAGGSGTYPFLIGVARVVSSELVVEQLFMREYCEEKAMLLYLASLLERCKGLVTFNGKSYDLPLLETRFVINKLKVSWEDLPHFDLLYPSRALWKPMVEDCRLETLASSVLGVKRENDLPGSMVPQAYFRYLREGDVEPLLQVARHNREDLLAMLGLLSLLSTWLQSLDLPLGFGSVEAFCLGRFLVRAGCLREGYKWLEWAWGKCLPKALRYDACRLMAEALRKSGEVVQAVTWWKRAWREKPGDPRAAERLAIHLEHRRRDFGQALKLVDFVLNYSRLSPAWKKRFEYRRRRLHRRVSGRRGLTALPLQQAT